ncbi:MAG: zinc-binding alcohol dehydrogenase [Opitutaceae bacterium]|jgi:2-desacetyl-2-hydroxyethyl bacteriochlorophyllide A dehydrogenase
MSTTPPTGLRLVFPEGNRVETESFTPASPAADEVVIKTSVSLLSTGTETIVYARKFDSGTHWDNWIKYPFYPGYCAVGDVVAIGTDVTALKVGDRVAHRAGHASHAVCKTDACFPVPTGVAPEDAVWFPLAKIAGHGARAANITLGDSVVVIGAGPIGQMAARWALAGGASKVVVLDLSETRLKMAAASGAIPVMASSDQALDAIKAALGGNRPRSVIDSTGNAAVLRTAFGLVADFGTVVVLGDTGSPGSQTLTGDVIMRGIRIVGAHDTHNTPEWNNAVAAAHFFTFVQSGRFSMQGLNTHHFRPEACKEAYTLATTDRLRTMGILFDWTHV